MFNDNSIMKYETTLPEDFTGIFHFTNFSEEDFVGKWGGKEYHYPAQSTSPMVIPEHSPLEVQHIRKKFAKDLSEREYYRSESYSKLLNQERNPDGSPRLNSIHQGGSYSIDQLTPLIQKCLEPLPVTRAKVTVAEKPNLEETLSRNEKGELNTKAIGEKESLRDQALKA
jgi:hypothetical protein